MIEDVSANSAMVLKAAAVSVASAERQLEVIGRSSDDKALAVLVNELGPDTVFALTAEADISKASLATIYAQPPLLMEAFERIGASWGMPADVLDESEARRIRQMLEDVLVSMVYACDDSDKQSQVVKELVLREYASDVLYALSYGQKDVPAVSDTGIVGVYTGPTWQGLWLMAAEIKPEILREWAACKASQQEDPRWSARHITDIARELSVLAASHKALPEETEEDFLPL